MRWSLITVQIVIFAADRFQGGAFSSEESLLKPRDALPHKELLSKAESLEMLIVIRIFASIGKLVNFNAEVV